MKNGTRIGVVATAFAAAALLLQGQAQAASPSPEGTAGSPLSGLSPLAVGTTDGLQATGVPESGGLLGDGGGLLGGLLGGSGGGLLGGLLGGGGGGGGLLGG